MPLTLEEKLRNKAKTLQAGKGLTLEQKLRNKVTGGQKQQYLGGGKISDLFDILRTGEFAAGGLLSGKGVKEGIKQKISPSQALKISKLTGIKPLDVAIAFGADVLLDPLTYTGIGALTKLGKGAQATGKLAPTIGKQAGAGQRALLSFLGQPVIKGEKALGALGKAGTFLREGETGISRLTSPVIQSLGEKFVPSFKTKGMSEAERILREAIAKGHKIPRVSKDLEPLMKEARKYKSADEFVKAQGTPVYHGTSLENANKINIEGFKAGAGKGVSGQTSGDFVYATGNKAGASRYVSDRMGIKNPTVVEGGFNGKVLEIQGKMADFEAFGEASKKLGVPLEIGPQGKPTMLNMPAIKKAMQERGYGAIGFSDRYANGTKAYAILPESLKTKSQLTDIWNKANQKIQPQKEFDIKDILQQAKFGAKGRGALRTEETFELAGDIGKQLKDLESKGLFGQVEKESLLQAIERSESIPKGLEPILGKTQKFLGETKEARIKHGKAILEQSDLEYLPHFRKLDDAEKSNRLLGGSKIFSTKSPSDLQRGIEGSIVEINKKAGRPIFDEDLPTLIAVAGTRTAKLEAGSHFLDGVKELGLDTAKAPSSWIKSTSPELKGLVFHPDIAKHIDETYKAFTQFEDVDDFIKLFDKVQNTWKGLATSVNPAFHSRNAISNFWQNYLAGMNPLTPGTVKAYGRAAEILSKKLQGKLSGEEKKLWDEFVSLNLARTGQFYGDIEQSLAERITTKNPLAKFMRGTQRFGDEIENHAKLAHYLFKKEKGFISEAAAQSVRKYLFDYTDLTDFERHVMKRIFPFYVWTRKNLPLQLSLLIQEPGKIAQLPKITSAIEAQFPKGQELDERLVPSWIQKGLPIYMGKDEKGNYRYFRLQGFIPSADIERVSEPGRELLAMLSPFIKSPIELAANYNTFFESPIEKFPGQKQEFLGVNLPAKFEYAIRQIRPLNEINKLADPDRTALENALNTIFGGKLDIVNEEKAKNLAKYLNSLTKSKITSAINNAKNRGDLKEVQRLKELQKELDSIKY